MEHAPQNEPIPMRTSDEVHLELTNEIQMRLIENHEGGPIAWIEANSAPFRRLIEAEPILLGDYKKNPEETIQVITERLKEATFH